MTPDRGDILHLQFDPASGREMKGKNYCLVLSPKNFNQQMQLAMVCPISGGMALPARSAGLLVSLTGLGLRTDGCVHIHQLKSLDWNSRQAQIIERVPAEIIEEVLSKIITIFE